jgi:hypothetical protein
MDQNDAKPGTRVRSPGGITGTILSEDSSITAAMRVKSSEHGYEHGKHEIPVAWDNGATTFMTAPALDPE